MKRLAESSIKNIEFTRCLSHKFPRSVLSNSDKPQLNRKKWVLFRIEWVNKNNIQYPTSRRLGYGSAGTEYPMKKEKDR